MATRKTGPVKPPTLDLQARKTPPQKGRSKTTPNKATSARAKSASPNAAGDTTSSAQQKTAGAAQASGQDQSTKPTPAKDSKESIAAKQFFLTPVLAAAIGVGGGAVLGVVLSQGLLILGFLQPLLPQTSNSRIDELTARVGISEEQLTEGLVGFKALNDQVTNLRLSTEQAINSLTARVNASEAATQAQLAEISAAQSGLTNSLEQVTSAPAPAPAEAFDPTPLEQQIGALNIRLDAIAAGASTDDAQKLALDLESLRLKVEALGRLGEQLTSLETQLSASEQAANEATQIAQRASELAKANTIKFTELASQIQTRADSAPPVPDTSVSAQIPLVLLELDAALNQGDPFESQLLALSTTLPDLTISTDLAGFAASGLPTPEDLSSNFAAAMPALLAARPINQGANWQENLWQRLKSLIALRPTDQSGIEGVDASIARLEAAMGQRNYAEANRALAELPENMRNTLGPLPLELEALQELQDLRALVRANALSNQPTSGVSQ